VADASSEHHQILSVHLALLEDSMLVEQTYGRSAKTSSPRTGRSTRCCRISWRRSTGSMIRTCGSGTRPSPDRSPGPRKPRRPQRGFGRRDPRSGDHRGHDLSRRTPRRSEEPRARLRHRRGKPDVPHRDHGALLGSRGRRGRGGDGGVQTCGDGDRRWRGRGGRLRPDGGDGPGVPGRRKAYAQRTRDLAKFARLPTVTRDGKTLLLLANIEFPEEADVALRSGADGWGSTARSSSSSTGRIPLPGGALRAYRKVAEKFVRHPVTIRTLDSRDKFASQFELAEEMNPAMGCGRSGSA